MRFKSLLLGSAAALIVAGGAQAADLTVAEPVDYVKVCDAFGKGFFYSPGTDTCIKIGGFVKFGTSFGDTDYKAYNSMYPNSNWSNFYTQASVQLTASSVTEYGNLNGFIEMRAQTGNTGGFSSSFDQVVNSATNSAYLYQGYLSLGPVKAGYLDSLFDFGQGYTDTGSFSSDTKTDQISLTYAVNGFGVALSIEDQRDRGSPGFDYDYGGQDNIPDIIGALTYASGIVSAKVAGAYTNVAVERAGNGSALTPYYYNPESGWAIGGSVELALDSFSAGDKFQIYAAYGDNANSYTGIAGGTSVAGISGYSSSTLANVAPGDSWSTFASYKHVWSPKVWSALTAGAASYDGDGVQYINSNLTAWRVAASTQFSPVKGLDLMVDGGYTDVSGEGRFKDGDAWALNLWMKRSW